MGEDSRRQGGASGLMDRRGERGVLDHFVSAVRAGGSRVLVVRGEPGVGKSALLDYLAGRASGCRVARAAGVESEMELAFAGLHQLLAPALNRIDRLPGPQREALRTAFGLRAGPVPDRFLVGLAVLGLVSEVAGERPLICVVDDEQWLDRASVQALGFAARRLAADPVGLVFAARVTGAELAGLPELAVEGLREEDARALLDSALTGPVDARVRDLIVAETRGNPLALLELPRGLGTAELAGGFGLPGVGSLPGRIEDSFRRQLEGLPVETRRLLTLAAADPSGDPLLVWRAAGQLGITVAAAAPAAGAGLVQFGVRVRFRHPLARSAAYLSVPVQQRQQVHAALAEATDPAADPDRRAWHRAQAAPGPDEDVAAELERSAGRAQGRGGLAAAAAFLERATALTPEQSRRSGRALAAAHAKLQAGALDDAASLLAAAESGPLSELEQAGVARLRGQISFLATRGSDATTQLLEAADRLSTLDPELARETYLEALTAAIYAGPLAAPGTSSAEVARAAKAAPRAPTPRGLDLLLDGLIALLTDTYVAAAPILRETHRAFGDEMSQSEQLGWIWGGTVSAMHLWDDEGWERLADRHLQLIRETGALGDLPIALAHRGQMHVFAGELTAAASLYEAIQEATELTGSQLAPYHAVAVMAMRGRAAEARRFMDKARAEVKGRGEGAGLEFIDWAEAVLYNGLGRYGEALAAAERVLEEAELVPVNWAMPELIEAAVRTGDRERAGQTGEQLTERATASGTEWALGLAARSHALVLGDEGADDLYVEAIEHLAHTRVAVDLARAHLLYGEWLRRQNRRVHAREQLRIAYQMFTDFGMEEFAERTRIELLATGEHARSRTVETLGHLTPQEEQISRLVAQGSSNREIAAQLFISPRTVEYHLHKAFRKLGVRSRMELAARAPARRRV